MVEIKHTISFAFPNGSAKPTMGEMANFAKTLNANPGDMDSMYRIAEEKAVFIKFKSEASVKHALVHNPMQLTFHYTNGKAVEVQMSLADGNIQYVRVYDLPPEVPDSDLTMVLGKYGKVKRVIREKFPAEFDLDMYTGVRGVYMDLEKEIPSSLNFLNRKGNIFYSGNKDKCFICMAEGHRMNSCPTRKNRKQRQTEKKTQDEQQDAVQNSVTYAGVVTGDIPLESENNRTGEVEVPSEEVVEMDVSPLEPKAPKQQRVIKYRNEESYKKALEEWKQQQKRHEEESKVLAAEKQRRRELRAQKKKEVYGISPPMKNQKNSSIAYHSDTASE